MITTSCTTLYNVTPTLRLLDFLIPLRLGKKHHLYLPRILQHHFAQYRSLLPLGDSPIMITLPASLARHLSHADLTTLQAIGENGDKDTFTTLARRYFSTWKTSLLGSDLESLRDLSLHDEISKFVTTIQIEDDWEANDPGPMIAGPDAGPPADAAHIWPRDKDRVVQSREIGIMDLRGMLIDLKFRPQIITIRDFHGGNVGCDPQPCAALARDLLEDVGMAVKSFAFRRDANSYGALEMTLNFFPEDQGQNVGMAKLQSAQFILTRNFGSYWQEQVLGAADPFNLTIAYAEPQPDVDAPFTVGTLAPKLTSLELVRREVSVKAVLDLISNSQKCLQSISFHMVRLVDDTSWRPLLLQIADEFCGLSSFKLGLLSIASRKTPSVKFQIRKDSVAEQDREGLEITERGPENERRVVAVRYNGQNARGVLQVVAESVVNWGYIPGTHNLIL
jgi:hypothetical protein